MLGGSLDLVSVNEKIWIFSIFKRFLIGGLFRARPQQFTFPMRHSINNRGLLERKRTLLGFRDPVMVHEWPKIFKTNDPSSLGLGKKVEG